MRELTKHATTRELHVLMDMVHEAAVVTPEQANLLYAIVDELTKRGEIDEITDEEMNAALEKTLLKAKQLDTEHTAVSQTELEWMEELSTDMLKDRQRRQSRRRTYFRTAITAASIIVILFLSNVVALASGHDFFGTVAKWTKDAVYFVLGGASEDELIVDVNPEYLVLDSRLEGRGIRIDLPAHIPAGFTFDSIEPDEPDISSDIIAWFVYGNDYFSIGIRLLSFSENGTINETDGTEYTEVYPETNGRYMITTNKNRIAAIWYQGIYEIIIQGNLTHEQLTNMLDSI